MVRNINKIYYNSNEKRIETNNFLILLLNLQNGGKLIIITTLITIIFFMLKYLYKNRNVRVCLCVIAKNENLYVREFIEHYKKIGYNNIFIYDNNDKEGEHFEEVINDYIKDGYVKIINFRERNDSTRPQFDAYKDCYSKNSKKFNWLSFYDMDEFLELNKKYKTVQEFLDDKIFEHCKSIKINWLLYKNDQALYYVNKPLCQRIKKFSYNDPGNKIIKTTVKGNLPINYWKGAKTPHSASFNYTSCSSSGRTVEYDSWIVNPPDFTNAKLKHYLYKSFEEWCIKIKRGKCDHPKKTSDQIKTRLYKSLYSINKNNPEKLKIIQNIFNESIDISR